MLLVVESCFFLDQTGMLEEEVCCWVCCCAPDMEVAAYQHKSQVWFGWCSKTRGQRLVSRRVDAESAARVNI